ncbi:DUF5666 domain-containing protein [Ktedonospora formicarum]|uniref:DUF5666 domain-containing protein n=1 Tax=Ktedonospora formicarum TaxID=2778364 RepID=A0A8J3IBT8_9CHLR|nr:DUF5666 domain-containing protein [Ktedonospora formicarum]GHO51106.1 hypothetical protein KSX_92690 [Ktedonospora formicarum]
MFRQKPSGKKILFLTSMLALMGAVFLMGGITMSSASANSLNKTPPKEKPPCSQSCNLTKGLATITNVNGNTIQAKLMGTEQKDNQVTLLTTAKTTYDPDRSIVAVGKSIVFAGTINHDGSITAQLITSYDPSATDVTGTIVKIDGSTITLQTKDTQSIVHLTNSTIFLKLDFKDKKKLPATLSDLKVGMTVTAHCTVHGNGSLTAQSVVIVPANSEVK